MNDGGHYGNENDLGDDDLEDQLSCIGKGYVVFSLC